MSVELWEQCLSNLQEEFPAQQYNTWIRPLKASPDSDSGLTLLAPNRFVKDWVSDKYLNRIREIVNAVSGDISGTVTIGIAGRSGGFSTRPVRPQPAPTPTPAPPVVRPTVTHFEAAEPVVR